MYEIMILVVLQSADLVIRWAGFKITVEILSKVVGIVVGVITAINIVRGGFHP